MTSKTAPKIQKKASKKSKKSWRKNTDIEDVEEFLEDQRLEERLGGAFKARKDEDIFMVDKGPEDSPLITRKTRKQLRAEKPLKCFHHLETKGKVADPVGQRTRVKTQQERQNPMLKAQITQKRLGGWKTASEISAHQDRSTALKAKKDQQAERKTRRRTNFDFDLWTETPGDVEKEIIQSDEWLSDTTKRHNLKESGKLTRKVPEDFHLKPSTLTAVSEPHPGESYNPSYKEHQDLMWQAAMVEMKKEKEHLKIEYHTTRMFPSVKDAPTQESWINEMSEGIKELEAAKKEEEETGSDEDVLEEEGEDEELTQRDNKVKTRKQRRKEIQLLAEDKRVRRLKEEKKKNQDVFRTKKFKRTLEAQEKVTQAKMRKRRLQKEAKLSQPAQLSTHKFEEPDLDLKLTEELTGNLRNIRPEGNILADRYNSLKRRNLVETRVPHKNVKNGKKRKRVEKRNYKMPWQKKD